MRFQISSMTQQQWNDFQTIHNDPSTGAISLEIANAPFGTQVIVTTQDQNLIDWIQKNLTFTVLPDDVTYDDTLTDAQITQMIVNKQDLTHVRPERIAKCTPLTADQIAAQKAADQDNRDTMIADILEAQHHDGAAFQKTQDELTAMTTNDLIDLHQQLDLKAQLIQKLIEPKIQQISSFQDQIDGLNSEIQSLQDQIKNDMQRQAQEDPSNVPIPDKDMTDRITYDQELIATCNTNIANLQASIASDRDTLKDKAFTDLQAMFTANLQATTLTSQ